MGNRFNEKDFNKVRDIMNLSPIREDEKQIEYYERIMPILPRPISRATLNIVFRSKTYDDYKTIMHGYKSSRDKKKNISVESLCPLEESTKVDETTKDEEPIQPPIEQERVIAPVYKNDRQSCLIADRIADVAIRAINALLDMDKRRNDLLASQS